MEWWEKIEKIIISAYVHTYYVILVGTLDPSEVPWQSNLDSLSQEESKCSFLHKIKNDISGEIFSQFSHRDTYHSIVYVNYNLHRDELTLFLGSQDVKTFQRRVVCNSSTRTIAEITFNHDTFFHYGWKIQKITLSLYFTYVHSFGTYIVRDCRRPHGPSS